jgi:hypothetical protein
MRKFISHLLFLIVIGCSQSPKNIISDAEKEYFVSLESTFPNMNNSEFGESLPFLAKNDSSAFVMAFRVWDRTKGLIEGANLGHEDKTIFMKTTNFKLMDSTGNDITERVNFVTKDSLLKIVADSK